MIRVYYRFNRPEGRWEITLDPTGPQARWNPSVWLHNKSELEGQNLMAERMLDGDDYFGIKPAFSRAMDVYRYTNTWLVKSVEDDERQWEEARHLRHMDERLGRAVLNAMWEAVTEAGEKPLFYVEP